MIFDLIAGMNAGGGAAVWTPADLFKNGEEGFWLDSSDYSTMFQLSDGTTPVTGAGQPVGLWKNKIAGQSQNFDVLQSTAASRPATITNSGKPSIRWDGVDDKLVSLSINVLTGQAVSAFIGFRRLQTGVVVQPMRVSGTSAVQNIQHQIDGSTLVSSFGQSVTLPIIAVNTWAVIGVLGQVNVTPVTGRLNSAATVGNMAFSGNVGGTVAMPYSGASLQYEVSQAVYINRVLTAGEITLLETFIASKQ